MPLSQIIMITRQNGRMLYMPSQGAGMRLTLQWLRKKGGSRIRQYHPHDAKQRAGFRKRYCVLLD
jgi:hypothetical protein